MTLPIKYSAFLQLSRQGKLVLCREYRTTHPTSLCRGQPYFTDAVTMETWRVWIWPTGCWTRCVVMLAERNTILESAEYFIHLFLYIFRFPVLLGCISPQRKQIGPAVHSVLCTIKFWFAEDCILQMYVESYQTFWVLRHELRVTRQFRWLYSRFRVPAWGKTVFTFL